MPRFSQRLQDGRRERIGRFHRDAFERELGIEHAADRLGLDDADLRAGERVIAGLQNQPLVAADRLVARIALDVDDSRW